MDVSLFSFHLPLFLSRCYNKTNGTFSSGTLPLMHRVAPCQQDGLEMVPLAQVPSQCCGTGSQTHAGDQEADARHWPDENKESSPSQHSCCLVGNNENCPADNTGETHFYTKCPRNISKYFLLLLPPPVCLTLSVCLVFFYFFVMQHQLIIIMTFITFCLYSSIQHESVNQMKLNILEKTATSPSPPTFFALVTVWNSYSSEKLYNYR